MRSFWNRRISILKNISTQKLESEFTANLRHCQRILCSWSKIHVAER